jgi:hypothetical protein
MFPGDFMGEYNYTIDTFLIKKPHELVAFLFAFHFNYRWITMIFLRALFPSGVSI